MSRHRAGVLGSPISHSLSPALHRAAYAALGLGWSYDAFEVDEWALPGFISELDGSWAGISLTMPLKSAVIPLLDSIDETASLITSVNTVIPCAEGWHGTNTDIHGIAEAVRPHLDVKPRRATLLGAGATARSAVAALERLGVRQVLVLARRPEAADDIARLARTLGLEASVGGLDPSAGALDADIVVSTLPGDAAGPWTTVARHAKGLLLDAAYHPWPTPLAAAWPTARIASGRDMLLWQAVEQVRLMTGRPAPVAAMAAVLGLEG